MDQKKIWDYFQREGIEIFSGSEYRLEFLFRKASRLARRRRIRVLNIGVGNGWLEERCSRQGWETCSLDPSEVAIERVIAKGIDGRIGLLEANPFPDNDFEVVFCSEVIEHLSEEKAPTGISEIRRVLRKGGSLVGTVPYREVLFEGLVVCPGCGAKHHRYGHRQSFDKTKMEALLQDAGFRNIRLNTYAFPDHQGILINRLKCSLHYLLGRIGSPLAAPFLVFIAQK